MQISDESDLTLICAIRFIVDSQNNVEQLKMQFPQYNIENYPYFKDKNENMQLP